MKTRVPDGIFDQPGESPSSAFLVKGQQIHVQVQPHIVGFLAVCQIHH
jgi:hypothetical protein